MSAALQLPSIWGTGSSLEEWAGKRGARNQQSVSAKSEPARDAVIFVLDVERCLDKLGALDRQMLSRIVLQEYLGMSVRAISYKFPQALDRLTERLLESGLLILPHS